MHGSKLENKLDSRQGAKAQSNRDCTLFLGVFAPLREFQFVSQIKQESIVRSLGFCVCLLMAGVAAAAPPGFVKTTIPLNAPPVGLAFDATGVLYALEGAAFGQREATLRMIHADGSFGPSFPISGDDPTNFFVGSMTFDPIGGRLLITDNTADGRLYAVTTAGAQQTIATGIAGIGGIAVRSSGEIFVSTSPFGSAGAVSQVDRATGVPTTVLGGLGYGAGLAFDPSGNLIVQDANTTTFRGQLQRLPTSLVGGQLAFGAPVPLLGDMQSAAGVVTIGDAIYTTGSGGLYQVMGTPLAEVPFDANGNPSQFATAVAFDPGTQPFQAFAGPNGGRLAYMADFGFTAQDSFVTLLTPAEPGDYNGDGHVNALDRAVWRAALGSDNPMADGNRDGHVDAADYVLWRAHASTMLSADSTIPEPSIHALFTVLCAFGRRRSRRLLRNGNR